jgi:hypothetical protein
MIEQQQARISGAQSARRAFWLPLLIFGATAAAAVPLYREAHSQLCFGYCAVATFSPYGLMGVDAVSRIARVYWLCALPIGYLATVVYYQRLRGGWRPTVRGLFCALTGAAIMLAGTVVTATGWTGFRRTSFEPINLLAFHATTPIMAIGLGVLTLGFLERSYALSIFAVAFVALTLVATMYNFGYYLWRLGVYPDIMKNPALQFLPNVAIPAIVLLVAGLYSLARGRSNATD